MNRTTREEKAKYIRLSFLCISLGTVSGLILYQIFLYYNIAIFGWNLGLIFAPLIAGYVETILEERWLGENLGAISALILFVYTTFYSFILKNPTLGFNFITIGSILVILQAAFPTAVNYIIFTAGLEMILYILAILKAPLRFIYYTSKAFIYKFILKKPIAMRIESDYEFDEAHSNELINSQNFFFMTSTDTVEKRIINVGYFSSTVIIEKATVRTPPDPKKFEKETIYHLKKGKDRCLIDLANKIKSARGNGVLNLEIQYTLIGVGGDSYQVTASGMGIYLS